MKLDKIKISGYKSVEDVELPIKKYGDCGSYTTIFLGKNETGKSNTLDAIAIPITMDLGLNTDFLSTRTAQTESEKNIYLLRILYRRFRRESEKYRYY